MGTSHDLLRLLDPAVRPVGPVSPTRKAATVPFEQRGFDELLADFAASESETTADGTLVAAESSGSKRSAVLDLSRIENASLRTMLFQRHEDAAQRSAQNLPT